MTFALHRRYQKINSTVGFLSDKPQKGMTPDMIKHPKKFLPLLVALCLVTALLPAGCSGDKTPNFPATAGGVTVEAKPETIASLSPSVTEILYGIGSEKKLIARSENCANNGEVRLLPSVGTSIAPDITKLLELHPSVLMTPVALSKENTLTLTDAGIAIAVLPVPTSITALRQRIIDIGTLLAGNNGGSKLIADYLTKFDNEIEYVRTKLLNVERKTGVFVLSADGSVVTGDTLLGDILTAAGVTNVAAEYTNYQMPAADLLAANPAVIICTNPPGIDNLSLIDSVRNLPALASGNVYELNYEFADRYSAEITLALYAIAYALYPDAMATPDIPVSSGQTSSAFTPSIDAPSLMTESEAAAAAAASAAAAVSATNSATASATTSGTASAAVSSVASSVASSSKK